MDRNGRLKFSVDAALLRELGERLVGQAHVALGELIKNSYDADSRNCEIRFSEDQIILCDDGHGMTPADFESFWMRVGTTHKATQAASIELKRPLTGSKGVGRLAVQFLAQHLKIETRAKGRRELLTVRVNWPAAVAASQLVEAAVDYDIEDQSSVFFADGAAHGMRITLSGLNHEWNTGALRAVAREVWELVPPFEEQDRNSFRVSVSSSNGGELTSGFSSQLRAALEQWTARIRGEIVRDSSGSAIERVVVDFSDGQSYSESFPIDNCLLNKADWEIKVYNLRGRLANDVPVNEARIYLERYGGVHVYDGPFRLPYYGVNQDWLSLEFDHSHRRVKSKLLPDALHVQRALNDLPTQGRLFGVVRINTGIEQRHSSEFDESSVEHLQIQVTRDRLVSNAAYDQLRDGVRRSIDYYATRSMLRRIQSAHANRPSEQPSERISRMSSVLSTYEGAVQPEIYISLKQEIDDFVAASRREAEYVESIQQLLGPLASAGMAALALEHETNRELLILDSIADQIAGTKGKKFDPQATADSLRAWVRRVKETRSVFTPLLSNEDRSAGHRLLVEKIVERTIASTKAFTEAAVIEVDVDRDLRFPEGSVAEWSSILQNLLVNAVNAIPSSRRDLNILIEGQSEGGRAGVLWVSDDGSGIDLSASEALFDPFRRTAQQPNRLGLGGLGLGLTIVRMIADSRKCRVSFVQPRPGYRTTFEMKWK